MKRLLVLTVVMVVAAAATGCSLFNRNSCDPCATGMGGMGGGMVGAGGSYTTAPAGVMTNGGYLPTPN